MLLWDVFTYKMITIPGWVDSPSKWSRQFPNDALFQN